MAFGIWWNVIFKIYIESSQAHFMCNICHFKHRIAPTLNKSFIIHVLNLLFYFYSFGIIPQHSGRAIYSVSRNLSTF